MCQHPLHQPCRLCGCSSFLLKEGNSVCTSTSEGVCAAPQRHSVFAGCYVSISEAFPKWNHRDAEGKICLVELLMTHWLLKCRPDYTLLGARRQRPKMLENAAVILESLLDLLSCCGLICVRLFLQSYKETEFMQLVWVTRSHLIPGNRLHSLTDAVLLMTSPIHTFLINVLQVFLPESLSVMIYPPSCTVLLSLTTGLSYKYTLCFVYFVPAAFRFHTS